VAQLTQSVVGRQDLDCNLLHRSIIIDAQDTCRKTLNALQSIAAPTTKRTTDAGLDSDPPIASDDSLDDAGPQPEIGSPAARKWDGSARAAG